jgi:hypothetical protein
VVLSRVDPGEETPNGAWKLAFEDPMSQADPSLFGGMDPKGMLASLQPYLGGLAVRRSITLPTRILATNGETSENGRTVSWSLSFAQLMEGKSLGMWVTFEPAEGMALQPFRVGPDLADLMRQAARQMKAGGMAPPGSGDSEGESGDPDEAPPEDTEPEDAPDAPGGQEPDAPGGQEPDAPGGQEPKDAPPGEGR